ncbi:MAG: sigma-70 family RNA polymerase sigma factor [Candidatus Peregrinibacteria bacterium]
MAQKKRTNIDSLVQLAQKGDAEAYGFIYDDLVKPVYRYIYYRVEPEIAEDLTEETFLKAWENLKQYKKGKYPFPAWVFRIAHNLVCDYYRKHQPVGEAHENIEDPQENRHPAFEINVHFNQVKLRKAITQLPHDHQQVIILKYINELSNDQIAQTLGKPEGTVRTIQFRALKKLRELLGSKREDF